MFLNKSRRKMQAH